MLTKPLSSISSFKPNKRFKWLRTKPAIIGIRLFKAVIFIIIFVLLEAQLAALLDPGRYKSNFHPRLRWEEFYRMDRNIDLAFIGSSHAYRSFDPFFFDQELGVTSFNFGHSDQNPVDSYYVLREVLRYHQPKLVVMELFFPLSEGKETNPINASYFQSASYVYDYIKPSWNKLASLFDEFAPKDYLKAVFHTIRDKDNYKKPKLVQQNLNRRVTEIKNWLTQSMPADTLPTKTSTGELYKGRGYVLNDGVASQKKLVDTNRLKVYENKLPDWDEKKLRYIEKIIDLCREHNISILLVTSPLPPSTMKILSLYDQIHAKYQEIADRKQVEYVDYNLTNKQRSLFTDKQFKDEDHLNSTGVGIFDKDMLQFMKPLLH